MCEDKYEERGAAAVCEVEDDEEEDVGNATVRTRARARSDLMRPCEEKHIVNCIITVQYITVQLSKFARK